MQITYALLEMKLELFTNIGNPLLTLVNFNSSINKWSHRRAVRGEIAYLLWNFNGCIGEFVHEFGNEQVIWLPTL